MRRLRVALFYMLVVVYLVVCPLTVLYALGYLYQPGPAQGIVKGEPLTADQRFEYRFDIFGKPGAPAVEPHDFGYFRKRLEEVRSITRAALQPLRDEDLDSSRVWDDNGEKREFSVRWILQHLTVHEAHHRGQMFMLKRALGF